MNKTSIPQDIDHLARLAREACVHRGIAETNDNFVVPANDLLSKITIKTRDLVSIAGIKITTRMKALANSRRN